MGFSIGGMLSDITKSALSYDDTKASVQPTSASPTFLDTVKTAGSDILKDTAGSAGTIAQNWVQRQAQEQLLDPLERDLFKPENTTGYNIQTPVTTGQSPVTNVPSVQPVLFDYKPQSSGNTAVFYIVGGAVAFLALIFFLKR